MIKLYVGRIPEVYIFVGTFFVAENGMYLVSENTWSTKLFLVGWRNRRGGRGGSRTERGEWRLWGCSWWRQMTYQKNRHRLKISEMRRWRTGNLCWVCGFNIVCKSHGCNFSIAGYLWRTGCRTRRTCIYRLGGYHVVYTEDIRGNKRVYFLTLKSYSCSCIYKYTWEWPKIRGSFIRCFLWGWYL